MTTKVTLNSKISVDGQAYASADDMPSDTREVYERALEWVDGGMYKGPISIFTGKRGLTDKGHASGDVDVTVSNLQ